MFNKRHIALTFAAVAFGSFIVGQDMPAAIVACISLAGVWAADVFEYLEAKTAKPAQSLIETQRSVAILQVELAEMKSKVSGLAIAATIPFQRR